MEDLKEENQTLESDSPPPEEESGVVRQLEEKNQGWGRAIFSSLVILLILVAGGISGYFLSRGFGGKAGVIKKKLNGQSELIVGTEEVGIKDERVFRDTTQGRIETNDFSQVKEGSHKILRTGGESQTAYLTSSVVDLDQFLGKCVQVWGETFSSQTAGWLMDVGRVKILDNCPEGL